jgi:threonine dehydrogenase-like Zn-dependent dehydrogenase
VVCIDTAPARLALARSHGATDALHAVAGEARQGLAQLTGGRLADVVYDATGNADAFAGSLGLARPFGRVVLMGDTGRRAATINLGTILLGGLAVVGAHDDHPPAEPSAQDQWTHRRMAELFLELVRRGQMVVGSLTTHRFSGDDAADAYGLLRERRGEAMGVILEWD